MANWGDKVRWRQYIVHYINKYPSVAAAATAGDNYKNNNIITTADTSNVL